VVHLWEEYRRKDYLDDGYMPTSEGEELVNHIEEDLERWGEDLYEVGEVYTSISRPNAIELMLEVDRAEKVSELKEERLLRKTDIESREQFEHIVDGLKESGVLNELHEIPQLSYTGGKVCENIKDRI